MNLVELCLSASWGGLEMRCVDDAVRLHERGHTVIPVVRKNTPLADQFRTHGLNPYTISARDYFSPIASIRLASLFRKRKITAVHLHRSQDLALTVMAADLGCVSHRVLTLRMESEHRKFDLYHRWVYSRLTAVLTLTGRLRRMVIDNRPINPDKVHCLYNGIDFSELRSAAEPKETIRSRWGVPVDSFVVGIVGRLDVLKGQRTLIRAVSGLKDVIPDLKLIIVGEESVGEPGERIYLESLTAELGLERHVIFTGHLHPPGIIVPAFDIAVMASRKETFGNVAVEASGLGVPVIATDAGGAPEIIEHGRNGLLVQPEDPDALADALKTLYQHPETGRKMGEEGRIMAERRFGIEKHMTGLEKALGG